LVVATPAACARCWSWRIALAHSAQGRCHRRQVRRLPLASAERSNLWRGCDLDFGKIVGAASRGSSRQARFHDCWPLGPSTGRISRNPLACRWNCYGRLLQPMPARLPQLESTAKRRRGVAAEAGARSRHLNRVGSMWTCSSLRSGHHYARPLTTRPHLPLPSCDAEWDSGVWLPPSQFEAAF